MERHTVLAAQAPKTSKWASHPLVLTMAFNAFWLLCVWGQSGVLAVGVLLFVGIALRQSMAFALRWAWIGIGVDFLLYRAGIHQFEGPLFPLWLIALWFGLSIYLHRMGAALAKMPMLVLVPGTAISGVLSYWAGLRLGAVQWPMGLESTLVLMAAVWLIMGLAIALLCRHYWGEEAR